VTRDQLRNLITFLIAFPFLLIPRPKAYIRTLIGAAWTKLRHSWNPAFEIEDYWTDTATTTEQPFDPQALLEKLCTRFHLVARQLRDRYDDRETITIGDEYDVQDLLHGLLRLFFDDIRPEEWTPSYAGKTSRMDFLLKDHKIVIETKMTRKGLGAKEIGTQLIEDIARYRKHPDCKSLVCFVYDPDGLVANPTGIENDLATTENGFSVRVIIRPSGH
jgi:hypothetical protein